MDLSTGLEVHRYLATSDWLNTMARISAVYPFCQDTQSRTHVLFSRYEPGTLWNGSMRCTHSVRTNNHTRFTLSLRARNTMEWIDAVYPFRQDTHTQVLLSHYEHGTPRMLCTHSLITHNNGVIWTIYFKQRDEKKANADIPSVPETSFQFLWELHVVLLYSSFGTHSHERGGLELILSLLRYILAQ